MRFVLPVAYRGAGENSARSRGGCPCVFRAASTRCRSVAVAMQSLTSRQRSASRKWGDAGFYLYFVPIEVLDHPVHSCHDLLCGTRDLVFPLDKKHAAW